MVWEQWLLTKEPIQIPLLWIGQVVHIAWMLGQNGTVSRPYKSNDGTWKSLP
jgi:hypothetical protein